jgi:hypothetical protein
MCTYTYVCIMLYGYGFPEFLCMRLFAGYYIHICIDDCNMLLAKRAYIETVYIHTRFMCMYVYMYINTYVCMYNVVWIWVSGVSLFVAFCCLQHTYVHIYVHRRL